MFSPNWNTTLVTILVVTAVLTSGLKSAEAIQANSQSRPSEALAELPDMNNED